MKWFCSLLLLLASCTKKTPCWMLEQLEEDFANVTEITQEAILEATSQLKPYSSMVIHYRIIDNELYRYFPEGDPIALSDNSTEHAIKKIAKKTRLPNADFFIAYFDGFPFAIPPQELKVPLLVTAKLKGTMNGILIPDYRSLGDWWKRDYKQIERKQIVWEKKQSSAFWRGGFTKQIRYYLCHLSLQNPDILDARLSSPPCEPELKEQFEKEGLFAERSSWKQYLSYKYLPYVDGVMCAAPALQWRLLSGSLTFKPDSDEIQWFYRALKPYVHYVPVKNDLTDLLEKIDWAKTHDGECKKIAKRARVFAQENLKIGDVRKYLGLVLQRYGSHQNFTWENVTRNERWINLNKRDALQIHAGQAGYCHESTPLGF